MNPYLEAFWGDVHARLTLYACDALNPQLPRDLIARVEEYLALETDDNGERRGYFPDVKVREQANGGLATAVAAGIATEPIVVPIDLEQPTERAIHILDRGTGNRVVTAIEFLSPGNKAGGEATAAYRRKQRDFVDARVNVVEIDLLREGTYVLLPPQLALPGKCRTPYRVSVVRATRRGQAEVYRAAFDQKLPTMRIPLRATDPDVLLDLQMVVDKCYEIGRYHQAIDYRGNPSPPLEGADAAWCAQLLQEKNLRLDMAE
jgi:hypothetical protein